MLVLAVGCVLVTNQKKKKLEKEEKEGKGKKYNLYELMKEAAQPTTTSTIQEHQRNTKERTTRDNKYKHSNGSSISPLYQPASGPINKSKESIHCGAREGSSSITQ